MSLVGDTLSSAREQGRAALIGFVPAWFPARGLDVDVMAAMVEGGVDIIEVGVPYSDPLMDGPTIQTAATRSLESGIRITDVLETVGCAAATGAPSLAMSYWNPIERFGPAEFAAELSAKGGAGVITPDLPPEEAGEWCATAHATGLDTVFLAAPSSTVERLVAVASVSTGFVYAASIMGVTGARAKVSTSARTLVARIRDVCSLPVCVGLGVSNGAQAAEVAEYADGVIVGSAFLNAIAESPPGKEPEVARALAIELAHGVRRG